MATNANISLDTCDWALPPLDPAIASTAKVAMVEVGTNKNPETANLGPGRREGWYNVAVDPLHNEGEILWDNGRATVLVSAAVAPERGATNFSMNSFFTSVSAVQSTKQINALAKSKPTQPAALVPLEEVLVRYVPAGVDARLLLVDAQGFDTAVVLSAGANQIKRFRYVVIECQELWPDHPKRYSPNSPNCTEAAHRLKVEGGLEFLACMRNVAMNEYNCLFAQNNHPLVSADGGLAQARKRIAESQVDAQVDVKTHAINAGTMQPSYSIQQLNHLVPDAQDAADLATVLCYMSNQTKPPDCPAITRLDELLDYVGACKFWRKFCRWRIGGIFDPNACIPAMRNRCNDPTRSIASGSRSR
jgi:hypothetical protein